MAVSEITYSIALIVLVLCCSHAYCREIHVPRGEREVTGEGEESSLQTGLGESLRTVCEHTSTAFVHDAHPLTLDGETEPRYKGIIFHDPFWIKPVKSPNNSMCAGLNYTCCKPLTEKKLQSVIFKEYREILHDVLQSEYFRSCPSIGRESYHSVRSSLNEAKRLLTIELQEALNTTLQNTRALDELFDYLIQFSVTADLCPLHWNIRKVVEDLLLTNVVSMVMNQAEESAVVDLDSIEQEQLNCLKNITGPYIAEFTPRISLVFQKLLVDYKLYVRSINLGRKVVLTVQNHRWSPACMTALARIKHCAYCGGYTKFRPCLNFCLNTLRGCLADVAEIYEEYKSFVAAFHSLSKDIDSNLKPETLVSKQFREFVTMVTEVREQSSLEYLATRECLVGVTTATEEDSTPTSSSDQPQDRQRRSRFSQPVNTDTDEKSGTSFNPNTDLSDNSVAQAFSNERKCFETFQELLTAIPQEMCYLNKGSAITHALNSRCWRGDSLGDYDDPLFGLTKREHMNNTAFVGRPLEMYTLYEPLLLELQAMTHEINNTLSVKAMCADSDDEDCIKEVAFECDEILPGESGSGSGSGSGSSGPNSGRGDLENGNTGSGPNAEKTDQSRSDLNQPLSEEFSKNLPLNDNMGDSTTTVRNRISDIAPTDQLIGTNGVIMISNTEGTQASSTSHTDHTPRPDTSNTEQSSSQTSSTTKHTSSSTTDPSTRKTSGSGVTYRGTVQTVGGRDGSSEAVTITWSLSMVLLMSVLGIVVN